jgi:hypothetical protein
MDLDQQSVPEAPRRREREERPKNSPSDNLPYRITGLEKAKTEPGMSPADLAALDRSIEKLKEKLAASNAPKAQD